VSDDCINFGAGSHACPGRFFASNEIKLIVAELLMNYDMRFAEGQGRPENMVHDFSIIPNFGAEFFMRKKQKTQ
jgi:ent-kaurene oxidase